MFSVKKMIAGRRVAQMVGPVIALAVPGWAFWRLARQMLSNPLGYDEQFFMWGGWSVLKGLAPYRDFIEFKPPMTFLTHALALRLFGYEGAHFRYFFFGLGLASVLALIGSLLRRGADPILACALGLAIVELFASPTFHEAFLSDTESMGTSYFFLGVALLIANTRRRAWAEIAGGFFMTCCAFSKEPFIPCVVLAWAGCYFMVHRRFKRGTALHYFKFTLTGVTIALGALCLYMVPTGAMTAYIATLRSYATMFRDPQKGYCVILGRFRPIGFFGDMPQQWNYIHWQFFNVATIGFLAPFFLATLLFVPKRSWALFATAFGAFLFALYGVTVSNCYALHYYIMAQSGLFFFLATGVDAIGRRIPLGSSALRLWVRSAVVLTVALQIWPRLETARGQVHDPPLPEPAPGIFEFIRKNSAPTDRIFTTGPPSLYAYTDRLSAVRESSIIDELIAAKPGNTDEEKLRPLYNELALHQPKIVFLDPEHGHRKHRHLDAAIMPFLAEFKYEKVSETIFVHR